jgi:hypothetical protein
VLEGDRQALEAAGSHLPDDVAVEPELAEHLFEQA